MSSSTESNDDIDLRYVFHKLRDFGRNILKSLFSAFDFIVKWWYVVLGLALIGVALGYYLDQNTPEFKEANVLVRAKYRSGEALYSAIETINKKIFEGEEAFLKSMDLDTLDPEIQSISVKPVVKLHDLIEYYGDNRTAIDPILRYVDFNLEEGPFYKTFTTDYEYHYIKVNLSEEGSEANLTTIIDHINNEPNLKVMTDVIVNGINDKIAANEVLIKQIDDFLEKYLEEDINDSSGTPDFVVESAQMPADLIERKDLFLREIRTLKERAAYQFQSIIPINGMEVYPKEIGFWDKKKFAYPAYLIMIFLGLALLRHIYFYLRKIADDA